MTSTSLPRGLQAQATAKVSFNNSARQAANAQTQAEAFASNGDNITTGTINPDQLPIATTSSLGVVQPDGVTILITPDGVISSVGGSSDTVEVTVTAGSSLSGHTVIYIDSSGLAQNPDITILSEGEGVIGITTGAIAPAATGPIVISGEVTEPSWTWTPGGPIWATNAGALSQTPPVGKWLLQMGVATAATKMVVNPTTVISTP